MVLNAAVSVSEAFCKVSTSAWTEVRLAARGALSLRSSAYLLFEASNLAVRESFSVRSRANALLEIDWTRRNDFLAEIKLVYREEFSLRNRANMHRLTLLEKD